jgi:methionyl aminopeptidase
MKYWEENGLRIGIKNKEEMAHMRESGRILGIILAEIEQMVKPGISCLDIDSKAASIMEKFKVKASFKGYQGFPNVICTNINEQVVHGIPSNKKLQEGDIITVDCGVIYKGFHSDSAISVGVGKITPEAQKLTSIAEKALSKGIDVAKPGIRVGKISEIIEKTVKKGGFSVVRDLIGHGIGKNLHEDPPVPNFKTSDPGPLLQPGMTIAIEPIITAGSPEIILGKDNWTYTTSDGSLATQVEHTIAITEKGIEILTKRPTL